VTCLVAVTSTLTGFLYMAFEAGPSAYEALLVHAGIVTLYAVVLPFYFYFNAKYKFAYLIRSAVCYVHSNYRYPGPLATAPVVGGGRILGSASKLGIVTPSEYAKFPRFG